MIKFYLKRPPVVIVEEKRKRELIFFITSFHFSVFKVSLFKKSVLILKPSKKTKFFIKRSQKPILIFGPETKELKDFLPPKGEIILNNDKQVVAKKTLANVITYGFEKESDFLITDLNFSKEGVNFKINYQGSVIPFWVKDIKEKKEVYDVASAIVASFALGLNLIQISQAFQNN